MRNKSPNHKNNLFETTIEKQFVKLWSEKYIYIYKQKLKENGIKTWLLTFESRDLTEGKEERNRRGFRQFPVDEIWLLAPNANFPVLINYSDREASSGAATKGEVNWIVGRKRG